MLEKQLKLSQDQVRVFNHTYFVNSQVEDFIFLTTPFISQFKFVLDIGGGYGHFALLLMSMTGLNVSVLDVDNHAIDACHEKGVRAFNDNAINPQHFEDIQIVSFNLVLHHLIGKNETQTNEIQTLAMSVWKNKVNYFFVNEYIYDSFLWDLSGKIIFFITKNKILSMACKLISIFIPSLKANTFGVGVRFRSHDEWRHFFYSNNFDVLSFRLGKPEKVSLARRFLLIKSIRRDSFLLKPRTPF